MAKLVDALDLGSSGETHKSSSLFTRTNFHCHYEQNEAIHLSYPRRWVSNAPQAIRRLYRRTCGHCVAIDSRLRGNDNKKVAIPKRQKKLAFREFIT